MKNRFISTGLFLFSLFISGILSAQTLAPSIINSAGGSHTIDGYVFEFSIGEMALVHTAATSNLIVTQGLLQPTVVHTGVSDLELTDGQISVYPNPVNDVLHIDANLPSGGILHLEVFDLNGKLINQQEINIASGNESSSLSFARIAAGNYVMKAVFTTNSQSYYRSFKIIKMN